MEKLHKTNRTLYVEAAPLVEPKISGIGHVLHSLVKALAKNQYIKEHYEIVLLVPKDRLYRLQAYGLANVRPKALPSTFLMKVFRKLNLFPPLDLAIGKGVYLFGNYVNWPLVLSKSITYVHDICFAIHPEFVQPNNQKMLARNVPKWIKRTDVVVTVSNSSKKEIVEYFKINSEKVAVIPNGVDRGVFYKRPATEIEAVKKKYQIVGDYIFYLGNIEPRKNLSRLLTAYSQLPNQLTKRYSLLIVGAEGWLNEDILKQIQGLQEDGYKIIHPAIYVPDEDLPALHSGATVLVHPALHEGFGISPLQALACGTPVAVSDIPVSREVLHDAALYFKPHDSDDMASKLGSLLGNVELGEKLVRRGQPRVDYFSWANSTDKIAALIKTLDGKI